MSERIQALVESETGFHRSAGIDARGTHQTGQQRSRDDGTIKQRPKERNLWTRTEREPWVRVRLDHD